jgi:cobalt-zinc-cadmium efflux system outer membrane protein
MVRRFVCAVLALCACVRAQTALSVEDAVRQAFSLRPELRATQNRLTASQALQHQATLLPNPHLFYQSENISPNINFAQGDDTYAYFQQLIQTSGSRKASIDLAKSNVQRSRLDLAQMRRDVGYGVRVAYWNARAAQFMRDLYADNSKYFDQIVSYQQARFSEGKLAELDLLRVQLQAQQVHSAAQVAQLNWDRARLELARAIGLSEAADWKLTEDFEVLEQPRPAPSGVEGRIEWQSARQSIAVANAQTSLAKAQGRPDLNALFGYKRTLGMNTAIAGFQVNVPIFNRNQGASAAAASEARAAEDDLRTVQLQLQTEIGLAKRTYEFRQDQVAHVYEPMRKRAIEVADISRAAFEQGRLDLLRVLDAQNLRLNAEISYGQALSDYHQSVVELERTQGLEP